VIEAGFWVKQLNQFWKASSLWQPYFIAEWGYRSAVLFVNMDDPAQIPAIAELWFWALNATVEFKPNATVTWA